MNSKEIYDRILLKELVDNISILGDKKDFKNQVLLFTENAISETISDGATILTLQGRKAMEEAFGAFLKDMETVYHFNGQQLLSINDKNATGKCYCLIRLIGTEAGKKTRTNIGAVYDDEYVWLENRWLINRRTGYFEWQVKEKIEQ